MKSVFLVVYTAMQCEYTSRATSCSIQERSNVTVAAQRRMGRPRRHPQSRASKVDWGLIVSQFAWMIMAPLIAFLYILTSSPNRHILGDIMNCTVRFGKHFLRVPLAYYLCCPVSCCQGKQGDLSEYVLFTKPHCTVHYVAKYSTQNSDEFVPVVPGSWPTQPPRQPEPARAHHAVPATHAARARGRPGAGGGAGGGRRRARPPRRRRQVRPEEDERRSRPQAEDDAEPRRRDQRREASPPAQGVLRAGTLDMVYKKHLKYPSSHDSIFSCKSD